MRDMYGPEQPDLMVPAMQPIVQEIFCEQQQEPIGKYIRDGYPVVAVADIEDQDIGAAEQKIDTAV